MLDLNDLAFSRDPLEMLRNPRPFAGGAEDSDSNNTEDGDDDQNTSDGDDDQDSSDSDKTLTQKEVNALIAREKAKAIKGKVDFKKLGFSSAKEMEEFVQKGREQQDQAKTDAEKALEQAKKDAAEEAKQSILSVANQRIIKAEFIMQASRFGVVDPDGAFAIAQTLEDWEVEVDEKGRVSGLDKDFFEELKKQKAYLFSEEDEDDDTSRDAGAGAGGNRRRKGKKNIREEELRDKYPALRR